VRMEAARPNLLLAARWARPGSAAAQCFIPVLPE